MKSVWTKHLKDKEDKVKLEQSIKASSVVLRELQRILKEKQKKPKSISYELAAWAFHRADMDGYNRAIEEVLSVIDLNSNDTKGNKTQ